jgi:hypothetical protein
MKRCLKNKTVDEIQDAVEVVVSILTAGCPYNFFADGAIF